MAFVRQSDWVSNQVYTKGAKAEVKGVVYEALADVTSTASPTQDGTNWRVSAVRSIQDYNSLVEAIRLQLNVESLPEVNDSVPMYIQLVEDSFKMRLRPPAGRVTKTFLLDSDGKFVPPSNLTEVINLRIVETGGTGSAPDWSRQYVEITVGDYEQYREIRAYYEGELDGSSVVYDSPVYWFDKDHFKISPKFPTNTKVELVYHAALPRLGETIHITNDAGEPLNSSKQTSAEWVADDAANTAENFVQNTQVVTNTWFLSVAPQLLLFGALLKAKAFVKDEAKIKHWEEMYVAAELELQDYIASFETRQAHTLTMSSAYLN